MANTQTLSAGAPPAVRRRVFDLALPAVGEQLLNTLVGLADIFLVGNLSLAASAALGYSSATGLAAVGLANQMIWLVTVLFIAMGIGSTALIARATGAGDIAAQHNILRQSMLIGLAAGIIGGLAIWWMGRPFLLALNAPADALPLSERYLLSIAAAFPTAGLLFVGMACLRGIGDTRTPLFLMLGVNGSNIVITWLLVNGNLGLPALGVTGAAIGTALARGGGGVVLVAMLLRGHSGLRLERRLNPDAAVLQRLARIGLPAAGEQLIFQGALLLFVRFVTGLGTVAYAAHNVTIAIESLSFLPGMGYAAAASALVGQALGARDPQLAEDYAYEALWQGGLMMSCAGLVMVVFPRALLSLFVNDPAVIETAVGPLRAAGLVQPALATSFILLGALRGAGDTRWPLLSRLMTTWALRLPLTLLFVGQWEMGMVGIWLAMCIDFTCQAILSIWRFSSGHWQRIEV